MPTPCRLNNLWSTRYYLVDGKSVLGYYCPGDLNYPTAEQRERGYWMLNTVCYQALLDELLRVSWLELLVETGTTRGNATDIAEIKAPHEAWYSW